MISNEVLLLNIIKSNSSFALLRERGLTYSQIALLIENLSSLGLLHINEREILLSNSGKDYLENNMNRVFRRKKDQWILPRTSFYQNSVSSDKIILPKYKYIK